MNARKRTILNAIERGPVSANTLAALTGAPQPSVRRLVQSLRNDGHDISFAFVEDGGVYQFNQFNDVELGTVDTPDPVDFDGNLL